jgi:hypothetical protein
MQRTKTNEFPRAVVEQRRRMIPGIIRQRGGVLDCLLGLVTLRPGWNHGLKVLNAESLSLIHPDALEVLKLLQDGQHLARAGNNEPFEWFVLSETDTQSIKTHFLIPQTNKLHLRSSMRQSNARC